MTQPQIVLGGTGDVNLNILGQTKLWCLSGIQGEGAAPTGQNLLITKATTASNLKVATAAAPGAGKSYTFTVQKNEADTAVVVAISEAGTSGLDSVNTLSLVAGDRIRLKCVSAGTPTATTAAWSIELSADGAQAFAENLGTVSATGVVYNGYLGTASGPNATETIRQIDAPMGGTINSIYAFLTAAPGAGKTRTVQLRKNGSDVVGAAVTISNTDVSGSTTGLSVTFVAGDVLSYSHTPAGTPAAAYICVGSGYTPSVEGESMLAGCDSASPSNTVAAYAPLGSVENPVGSWGAGTTWYGISGPTSWVLKKLRWRLTTAPGAAKSRQLQAVNNTTPLNGTLTISGTDTSGTDASNTDTITENTLLQVKTTPTGTPTGAGGNYWSAVQYIAPAASGSGAILISS